MIRSLQNNHETSLSSLNSLATNYHRLQLQKPYSKAAVTTQKQHYRPFLVYHYQHSSVLTVRLRIVLTGDSIRGRPSPFLYILQSLCRNRGRNIRKIQRGPTSSHYLKMMAVQMRSRQSHIRKSIEKQWNICEQSWLQMR